MSFKVTAAIAACKAARLAARILHKGGTAKPGEIALKICPDLLSIVSKDVQTVVVTGTNGKTTSCRMIEQAFEEEGKHCIANHSGANLMSGITTEFVMECTLGGKCRKQYAVMECDEGWTKHVLPALHPAVFVVTNLFQDQVDRYGDVSNTLAAIRAGVEGSPETVLVLNADDPVSATLASAGANPVRWFGIDETAGKIGEKPGRAEIRKCMFCGAELEYRYVNYAHLGGYACPACGHHRPDTDVGVREILELGPDSSTVRMQIAGENRQVIINQPALYNIENAAGTVAAAMAAGISTEAAIGAVEHFNCGFGRMEKFDIGAKGARMVLIKNAAGCNEVLRFLRSQKDPYTLVFVTNNRPADGTDISWLTDAEFESLAEQNNPRKIILSGICREKMHSRLREAGVAEERMAEEPDYSALTEQISKEECPVFVLPSYTGMMEFRPFLIRKCGGKEFWE